MKTNLPFVLAVLVIVAVAICFLAVSRLSAKPCPTNQFSSELCYYDSATNQSYLYDDKSELKCGEYVYAAVNISTFRTPANYIVCISGLNLNSTDASTGNITSIYYDRSSQTSFNCNSKAYSSATVNGAINEGYIPDVTGKQTFLSVYVYDANTAANYTLNDFMRNANVSSEIDSLEGIVTC